MAKVYLVSAHLVKKTNNLVAKTHRRHLVQHGMQDWVGLLDAKPTQQSDAQPRVEVKADSPSAVAAGETDRTVR